MSLSKETHEYQSRLAEYCRTGNIENTEGVREDRLHHYRRLTSNITKSALKNAYPITHKFLEKIQWDEMVEDYFANHKMQTPQVWKMPFEFYQFVEEKEYSKKYNIPFLDELLYFEWLEIELHTMEDIDIPDYNKEGDLLEDIPLLNPESELVSFKYPVHRVKPTELIGKEGNYFLLAFRKQNSGTIRFIELSPFFAFVIQTQDEQKINLKKAIEFTAKTFKIKDYNKAIQHGLALYNELFTQGFILGYLVYK